MKIDEQVLRLMVLCPVSPVSTQQYPLLNKNHFGKILYQIFSNLVSNSSRGLQSKNTELFLSSLKLCRAGTATGLAYLLRKLRSICVPSFRGDIRNSLILLEKHGQREGEKQKNISLGTFIKIHMFLRKKYILKAEMRTLSLLLRLGS